LIKFLKKIDTLINYHKSKFKNKRPGRFSEALGRTKTGGSHKKDENHPTLVITWAFDFLMMVMINVDTQIDTQFGFGAISNTPTHSVYILKFFSKEDNSEDKMAFNYSRKIYCKRGLKLKFLGPNRNRGTLSTLALPLHKTLT
jgi:hypothetical protein